MSREEYVSEFDPDGTGMMLAGMAQIADRIKSDLAQTYTRDEIDEETQLAQWTAEELVEVA